MGAPRWEIPGGDASQKLQGRANIKWGRVSRIDAVKELVRVVLEDNTTGDGEGLETYWLQVLVPKSEKDKYYHMPDVGDPVAVMMDEDGEEGYVLGSLYNEKTKPRRKTVDETEVFFENGTYLYHNRKTGLLEINVKGTLRLIADRIEISGKSTQVEGGSLNLSAGGTVLINGKPALVIGSIDNMSFINIQSGQSPTGTSVTPGAQI